MSRSRTVGVAALVVVLLVAVPAARLHPLALPLTVDLQGLGTGGTTGRTLLGTVVGRVAILIPAAAVAIGLLVLRRPGRIALLVLDGLAQPIAVFVVAQLNGVSDAGALILIYAMTAGGLLVRGLQERDRGGRPAELPLWAASAIGLVPWGAIALHQVGALLAGSTPTAGVRITTLVVLAAVIGELVVAWRGRRRSPEPSTAEAAMVALAPLLLAALGTLAVP